MSTPGARYAYVREVMQSRRVRADLKRRADQVAANARAAAGATSTPASRRNPVSVSRSDGTRPKGRPYSRVTVSGATEAERRQLLARAIR
jgi:hypothetical protein